MDKDIIQPYKDPTQDVLLRMKQKFNQEWKSLPRTKPGDDKLLNYITVRRKGGISGKRTYDILIFPGTASTVLEIDPFGSPEGSVVNGIPTKNMSLYNVGASNYLDIEIVANEKNEITELKHLYGSNLKFGGTFSIGSSNGIGTLAYTSGKVINFPDFEGNLKFDPALQKIFDAFKEMGIVEVKRPVIYTNCDFKKHPKSFTFMYFKYNNPGDHGFTSSEDYKKAKEVAITGYGRFWDYQGQMMECNVYLGNGNNQWRLFQANVNLSLKNINPKKPNKDDDEGIWINQQGIYKTITGTYKIQSEPDWDSNKLPNFDGKLTYVDHPRKIPGATQCDGEPWPPDGSIFPPGQTGLPTGHSSYLKCIEGSLETCWTFDNFTSQDDIWNINANNGRCLKYIKDAGCWHFFTSLPKSVQIKKYVLKNVVTNNKALYDHLNNTGAFEGTIKLNENPVDISKDYWLTSKNLYFASWTETVSEEKPQNQTWYLGLFNFADGTTIRKPDGTTTPIKGHFENGSIYKLEKGWTSTQQWKKVGEYPNYEFTKLPIYHNFQTNHRVLWGWMERHSRFDGNHSKFISPCTDPLPDGSLPPGVIGPPKPPKPQKPGAGGDGPIGPPAPPPVDPNAPITDASITCIKEFDPSRTNINDKLNGLYYYYLEQELFHTQGDRENTSILGTTEAICNIAYVPFLNIGPTNLCKTEFDVKRYGEFEGAKTPWVYRISMNVPKEMHIASWNVYPKDVERAVDPGTPWKYTHESRLFDFPYRRCVFYSNVFDAYEVIPHLHYQSSGNLTMELKTCCAVTPGGNFYAYVKGYKNDAEGFIERQFSNASMDIPNTSSAYSNYMSSQKAQASTALQQSALSNLGNAVPTIAPTMLAAAAIPGVNVAMVGAAALMGAAGSAGTSTLQSMQQNMAYRQDLMTTPKSLKSMGGDVIARLGCAGKATVISCDMVITDMYKDMLARFFQMYGTKQNRVLDVDSNIMSRYYYNYIKTVGCNISSNGVPKRHVATIKAIMDKGATFWHLDRAGVTYGEYCVYDNCEVRR